MEEMPDIAITCPCTIRGGDYIISLECKDNDSMTVQVEDRSTSDQWRSSFESQCKWTFLCNVVCEYRFLIVMLVGIYDAGHSEPL